MNTGRNVLLLCAGVAVLGAPVYAQTLIDARALGFGSYTAMVEDTREFSVNPAGIIHIRDWDLSASTYTTPSVKPVGFIFHGISIGKRLFHDEALAFRYSPGSTVKFVVPPVVTLSDGALPASNDREITYDENFAFAYAHQFSEQVVAGLGVRSRREEVVDTRYQIVVRDTISYPTATRVSLVSHEWLFDASIVWHPTSSLTFAAVGRNLLWFRGGDSGSPLDGYSLPTTPNADFGAAYMPHPAWGFAANASTVGTGGAGVEWTSSIGLALRAGLRWDTREAKTLNAFSLGVGWRYEYFDFNAGYLAFRKKSTHDGTTPVTSFDPASMTSLDLHPYSRNRIAVSVKGAFGFVRESLAHIEGVTIFGSIYPAAAELFAYKPVGTVRVKNVSDKPINARVSLFVDRIMDSPTESPASYVAPGAEIDIPLVAVFNEQVKKVTTLVVREGDVFVSATPAERYDDKSRTRLVILGRNAWDGDSKSLRYFVTPDDPAVLRYSRDVLLEHRDSLANIAPVLERFAKARVLINSFAGKLLYIHDPKLTADYVQYPAETLQLRGGDCDDMTVCFTSLLSSIGLSTAFVDVIPPDHPDQGHIYMLCDTGVEPRNGALVSANPKRYIVRRNAAGVETVWIPLETTVAAKGFDEAWTNGAQEYFDDVEVGLGMVKGWVRIVDVN